MGNRIVNMSRVGNLVKHHRYVFLGFGKAGKECLDLLLEFGCSREDILIYTYQLEDNEIFIDYLTQNNLKFSFSSIKDNLVFEEIVSFSPDVIISIYYRDLIPERIIGLAKFGGFNLHPSLLPRYAGCLSVMWAIIEGEEKTGITYHYLTACFDEGNILIQKEILISPKKRGFHIITNEVLKQFEEISLYEVGILHLFIKHTSASLTVNENAEILNLNKSISIPKKAQHRLENNDIIDLVVVEVQFGEILKEDDIVRYEDIYNRK